MIKKLMASLLALTMLLNIQGISWAASGEDEISWDEEIIYMIMTDRFYDGDETNNNPNNIEGSYDPSHLEAYHGGDFRGIIEKVDYFKDLGITTLWITPIVKNIEANMLATSNDKQFAYHGYWAEDFTQIDPHLGDEEDLKELIDILHDNGIKLMVDVVVNHSGYGTKNEGDFAGMHRDIPDPGDIKSELAGLPDFITEDKNVRDKIINWQVDWLTKLKTEKGNTIDYFRVDTVKNVDHDTWKDLKSAALVVDPDFKMIGESFDASVFNNGGYLDPTMMDSLLDFEFKDLAKSFVRGNIAETEKKLVNRNNAITAEKQMGQFLSSHDEHGFLKMKLGDDVGQFLVASSLQLTAKGQPVIYYGEEIGQSGRKDDIDKGIYSENRYDFDWEKVDNNPILDHYRKLITIRNEFKDVFARGDRENLYVDEDVSIFARNYNDEKIIVGINITNEDKTINFPINGKELKLVDIYGNQDVKIKNNEISVSIPKRDEGGTIVLAASDDPRVNEFKQSKSSVNSLIYIILPLLVFLGLIILKYKLRDE